MTKTESVVVQRQDTGLARLDPQALLGAAIEKGAAVETMERLLALAKEMRAEIAREAYHEAMAAFQARCPPVEKGKKATIATRSGSYEYHYASLDHITSTVVPLLTDVGLSHSWRHRVEGDKVLTICRITHRLGHYEESGEVPMPIGGGDDRSGANPAQRVGIAMTYGRRYSLTAILGIVPEDDPDAQGVEDRPGRAVDRETGEVLPDGVVVVTGVEEKAGRSDKTGKAWTRYVVTTSDGKSGSTFDAGIGAEAKRLQDAKRPVLAQWEQSGKYLNLTAIAATTARAELHDTINEERRVLLDAVRATCTQLHMTTAERKQLWTEHFGDAKPEMAEISVLGDVLRDLRAKLPQPPPEDDVPPIDEVLS